MRAFCVLFVLLLSSGCVGVDYIDDPIVPKRILVNVENIALSPGESFQATADYFDQYGIKQNVNVSWNSSNAIIAAVEPSGLIVARAVGQSEIRPSFEDVSGPGIVVNVVSDPNAVAAVEITSPSRQLNKGEKLQLNVTARNLAGDVLTGYEVKWYSTNQSIATVNSGGEIEGLAAGMIEVYAIVNDVKSNAIIFTVQSNIQTGKFVSTGFLAKGSAKIELINGELILTLSDDFETEFHIATHIYLSNSTQGSEIRASGIDLGRIYTNGKKVINVAAINPTIKLADYQYVVSFCKPASVPFGYAIMK